MEITINIPKNDYVQNKEVRQKVVQKICNFMLPNEHDYAPVFHPFCDGLYRCPDLWISREISKDSGKEILCGLTSYSMAHSRDKNPIRINGEEVKAAFKVLIDAGYHIFRVHEYGTWMGYKCSRKPFIEKGTEVTEFTDFID